MAMNKKIIVGNWKMNGNGDMLNVMTETLKGVDLSRATVILCPPMPYIGAASKSPVDFGAQDCSGHEPGTSGAFTGEVSAAMIAETGTKYVLVGHSERRLHHGETNAIVAEKAKQALKVGLTPIICIGETVEERNAGQTNAIVEAGLRECVPGKGCIVAYEPRWAISAVSGGIPATPKDIQEAHEFIAGILESMGLAGTPILYGASVNGDNAAEILTLPHIDGALVGAKSLKPADFFPVIEAVSNL